MGSVCFSHQKNKITWEGFVPPCEFKDGDVVATSSGDWIGITTGGQKCKFMPTYCVIKSYGEFEAYLDYKEKWQFHRFATEEEKQKLFDAIKDNGYKWNPETKTLEKLPKFKVGDRVKKNKDYISGIVTDIFDDSFKVNYDGGGCSYVQFHYQDDWELVPNKFDINTLVPFESRVLVRHNKDNKWCGSFFSHIDKDLYSNCYKFVTIAGKSYPMMIPYEGNEHLLSKTEDCDEYFKTW